MSAAEAGHTPGLKHTRGPWRTDPLLLVVEAKRWEGLYANICSIVRGGSPAEADANARLIASAPDLLAALRLFMARMNERGDWDDGCFYYEGRSASELQEPIRAARAAIALATGGKP